MLDELDYKEPACPFCDGKAFYDPDRDAPRGRVPINRVLEKLDAAFAKNDMAEAGRLLSYWHGEALSLRDARGELAILSETVGYYRKTGEEEKALSAVSRALTLVEALHQGDTVGGATVLLNCATAYKAFGRAGEAMPLYRRAEGIYQRELSQEDGRMGGLYNNMALALSDLADFRAAEEAFFRALAVMAHVENGEAEQAITYLNLAHMYEDAGEKENIQDCLAKAAALLDTPHLPRDGYYAFVCEKCAPSFTYFGMAETGARFRALSETIYAGN